MQHHLLLQFDNMQCGADNGRMQAGKCDVVVIGVGGMGSAVCRHLARRGRRVVGLEQFEIGHDRGSSHGQSRVIRKAYFEDSRYVPLLERSYELWRELETATGESLLHVGGGVNIGPADHVAIRGALESARRHNLPHEWLDAREISRRFPALRPGESDFGLYEPQAGFLRPERCVAAHVTDARTAGAEILERCAVRRVESDGAGLRVESDAGTWYADRIVVTAGAWIAPLLEVIGGGGRQPVFIERQVQLWFEPAEVDQTSPDRLPVFIQFTPEGVFYGLPNEGAGVKVCQHHGGASTTAEAVDRGVRPDDEAPVRRFVARHVPAANGPLRNGKVCLYTNTPDGHFLVGLAPHDPRIVVASGFSGHGFKFASVIGEIAADLAIDGRTRHPIGMFELSRFEHESRS